MKRTGLVIAGFDSEEPAESEPNGLNTAVIDNDVNTDAGQKFRSETTLAARYIKYVALESPHFYIFLGEINVYTPK